MDATVAEHTAENEEGAKGNNIFIISSNESDRQSLFNFLKVEETKEENRSKLKWKIDTKYYSVQTSIVSLHTSDLDKALKYENEVAGVVFVFSGEKEEEFEKEIKPWSSYLESKEPPVCLCLASKGTRENATKEEEKLYSKYNEWCIDNGVEFVGSFSFDSYEEEEEQGELFGRDKVGMERVKEGLESNMWPGMQYKTHQRPISSKQVESFDSRENESTLSLIENEQESKEKKGMEELKLDEKEDKHKMKQVEAEIKRRADSFFKELESMEEEVGGEEDESKQLKSFEKAMEQLNLVRNSTMQLSDKERREMAARVALSFLSELGDDEEEDSDDD